MVGCEYQKTGKVNFSNFSVPAVFLKSTHQEFQEQKPNKSSMELLPTVDEHSEAASASHNTAFDIRQKRKASAIDLCNDRGSSSVCSLEASNDPNYGLRKLHEETDDSPYFSDNEEEKQENMIQGKLAREGNRVKRSYRNAKVHNLSERKRRDKINEKIRTLRELIPNCNKTDKASMLDDAIDYLKNLKLQLHIMSMSRGLCMPFNHLMMLQTHHMNMNAQHLMGLRPPQVQFPIPQQSNGGVIENNNRVQMFGFSNQFPAAPFMAPIIGNSSTTPSPTCYDDIQNQPGRTCG
ncbi:hypothetical protein P8452_67727 [Trifolium repens]|nr:hypothetical protein P8452_67727 [Trifolium repens]